MYTEEERLAAFTCSICGVDTSCKTGICEYYMVTHKIWYEATNRKCYMLCIGCLEKRLGRRLNKHDFLDLPINGKPYPDGSIYHNERSVRLNDRLRREA